MKTIFLTSLIGCWTLQSLIPSPAHALREKDGQMIMDELSDYSLCHTRDRTGQYCQEAMRAWVKGHPADTFKAGKLVRLHMNHAAAIPFFAEAFNANAGDCKDEDVALAVVSGLGQPSDYPVVAQAKKIAFELCYPQVKAAILKNATIESYLFKNSCKELVAKGDLKGLKKQKCSDLQKKVTHD